MTTATDTGRRGADDYPPLKRIREDALPENLDYPDAGCELAARCLTCPLPRCKYDEPGGARRLLLEARDRRIAALGRARVPAAEIARRFGLSRRSVFRVLQQAREANQPVGPTSCRDGASAPSALALVPLSAKSERGGRRPG